ESLVRIERGVLVVVRRCRLADVLPRWQHGAPALVARDGRRAGRGESRPAAFEYLVLRPEFADRSACESDRGTDDLLSDSAADRARSADHAGVARDRGTVAAS